MTDTGVGKQANDLINKIKVFFDGHNALIKRWEAARKLPEIPPATIFEKLCKFTASVGTQDPIENHAKYMEELKTIAKLVAGHPNPWEKTLQMFQKDAHEIVENFKTASEESKTAMAAIAKVIDEAASEEHDLSKHVQEAADILDLLKTEHDTSDQNLKDFIAGGGDSKKGYNFVKQLKEADAKKITDTEAEIEHAKSERDKYEGWASESQLTFDDDNDYYADLGRQNVMESKAQAERDNIKIKTGLLPGYKTTACKSNNAFKKMDEEKSTREHYIDVMQHLIDALKGLQPELAAISKDSESTQNKMEDDLEAFTACHSHAGFLKNKASLLEDKMQRYLPERSNLSERVVAIVNQGAYFAGRPVILNWLRQILSEVEKANNWKLDETKELRKSVDAVSGLLNSVASAVAAGKHGKELPQPLALTIG
ncbi:hypothetical protein BU24DRAFT_473281 [Aaosphaeria arxii CBS 175.79]|uniref:Uncharacterized protein n=1 Tax=Aaosphaeria arxii CBS 175.79 TaxID=1450172 RepID=A0A6A5XB17_9PLEO|nr:uncharacterized protein BU24DRAFT_473281 [Aaosphaeria arxii CBS 175.79]KAF2010099.1 hypothetical protein BU24DRAFT_473281 [Aaosphaeria arxii CBS 175.79]